MDSKGFQEHCTMLAERVENNTLNDGDLDTFSDIVTNVLGRDDFKAPGTAYEQLSRRISDIYEKALIQPMPPLIARLYQICRMFEMYRPRPMTELEIKSERAEERSNAPKKYPLLIDVRRGLKRVANCWWENRGGTDEASKLLADFSEALGDGESESDIINAFVAVGGGFESLDELSQKTYPDVPLITSRESGVIGVGDAGTARNMKRHGHQVKIDLTNRSVFSDNYMIWGAEYYAESNGMDLQELDVDSLPTWPGGLICFTLADARNVSERICELPNVLAKPNSKNQIVAKFASS